LSSHCVFTVSLFLLSHKKSCKSLNPGHPDMANATLRYQTKKYTL
jgi:hypothetical protein